MPLHLQEKSNLLRALLTATILSTLPLLDFYAANMAELASPWRVLHYAAGTLAAAAILATGLALLLRKIPLWRILLATGLMVFMFFAYDVNLIQHELKAHLGDWAPAAWTAVAIGTGALALRLLRETVAITICLVVSLAFSAPALARIATILTREHRAQAHTADSSEPAAARFRISPNIYWIVLDGYPREDVLKEEFAFDNGDFIRSLAALDFVVLGKSRSNFPSTVNSISSTLNSDYTVTGEGDALEPLAVETMQAIVRGKSRTVSRLTTAGYNYVHFENGYDYLTECAPDAPKCVRGNLGLDELDIAILSNTPIVDLILEHQQSAPFAWGGVNDLTAKLDAVRATPSPFFLYAHVLAPHPPIRFTADCGFRAGDPDLQHWIPTKRPAFIDQLRCTNSQTLTLLQKIVQSDSDALIILQSDHGTAFRGQLKRPPTDWSDADLHERFGALNAMRLPAQCRAAAADDLTLVDTFPLVFSCLAGSTFERHSPRFFVTPYDDNADFGRAVEYPSERVR
ncbi:sulfatase-like hydrolase/transferase [Bradyrhizobium sp. UFLA05-112]